MSEATPQPVKPWRLRFGLRTAILVVVAVAGVLGWMVRLTTVETFYPDGSLREKCTVRITRKGEEILSGRYTLFHPNGRVWAVGQHRDDEPVGKWTYWWETGTKSEVIDFASGRQTLYREDGSKELERQFRDGVWTGRSTEWHANGRKAAEGEYREGRQHGEWPTWDEQGNLVKKDRYDYGILMP